MSNASSTRNTRHMTHLALLIALLVVLAATPLGFLQTPLFSVIIVHIPVLIGAVTLGVKAGAILGTCFGISSIVVSTMRATPTEIVFTPFLSGSLLSVILAVLPRILCGVFAALVFQAVRKLLRGKEPVAAAVAAAVGSLTNTVLVLTFIYLFFGEMYAGLFELAYEALLGAMLAVVATNGIPEMLAAVVICAALVTPIKRVIGGK